MNITAVFCIYNEQEYLEYAVESILPAVDRVILCLGKTPYNAYNPVAREVSSPDGTEALAEALARRERKITLIKGTWASEVDHRNTGLGECLKDDADYYWLVDGDDIYQEDHLRNIRQEIERNPKAGTFIIKCHIFWRSFSYRIPAQELTWRPRRIFKMTRTRRILGIPFPHALRFVGQNEMNSLGPVLELPPERAVFYHFSYARSSPAMEDKFRTFSHAHEIRPEWIRNVWKRWPAQREMTQIHPVDPPKFPRAVYQSPEDLPEVLRKHPFYRMEIIP